MYYLGKEHHPPHIHVNYGDYNAIIKISNGVVLEGKIPKRIRRHVTRWLDIHRDELLTMWETQEFKKLLPLSEGERYVS